MIYRKTSAVIGVFLLLTRVCLAQLQSPASFLGFEPGDAQKLADMHQIVDYFYLLDENSDRVMVKEIGKTTEGNPFIVATISSAGNLCNLDRYKNYQQLLADPRKITAEQADAIVNQGKTVVMINCSLH
ncbi:MAG TPA: hypothetical protein ENN22_02075, partial [bacterium]|nr:hypothetical protein [bacterium]